MDSMMNKMAFSQINCNSARGSRRPSRPYKSNKHSQSPRQGFSRNQYNSRERYKSNQKNNTGSSSSAFRRNFNSPSPRRHLSNSSRSPTDALILIEKLFAISATVKGTIKRIVATAGHVDLVLIQEETVHRQIRNKKK